MGATDDFRLRPVHAHINLLGWATNALMGYFHWIARRPADCLAWASFTALNLGSLILCAGLTALLFGIPGPAPFMGGGTILVVTGVLTFGSIILRATWRRGDG